MSLESLHFVWNFLNVVRCTFASNGWLHSPYGQWTLLQNDGFLLLKIFRCWLFKFGHLEELRLNPKKNSLVLHLQSGSSFSNHFQLNSPSSVGGACWCDVFFTFDGVCFDSNELLLFSITAVDVETHASFILYRCNFKSASNIGDRHVRIFSTFWHWLNSNQIELDHSPIRAHKKFLNVNLTQFFDYKRFHGIQWQLIECMTKLIKCHLGHRPPPL